jgi:hypothetical protein
MHIISFLRIIHVRLLTEFYNIHGYEKYSIVFCTLCEGMYKTRQKSENVIDDNLAAFIKKWEKQQND